MLKCCKCGREDYPVPDGFVEGKLVYSHHIQHDVYPLGDRNFITPEERTQGFQYKFFNGEHIKYRDLCAPCLIKQEDTRRVREAMRKDVENAFAERNPKRSDFALWCQFSS